MERTSTEREAAIAAVLCFGLIVCSSSLAHASDAKQAGPTWPVVAGAWAVDAGQATERVGVEGRVVEIRDGRLRLEREGRWLLTAQEITLTYDVLGRLDSVGAHGQVRLVGRGGGRTPVSYAMGEVAWFDATGMRGLLMGRDVAVVRDAWRLGAARIDVDFGAAKLALRGVKSGDNRARRDDK